MGLHSQAYCSVPLTLRQRLKMDVSLENAEFPTKGNTSAAEGARFFFPETESLRQKDRVFNPYRFLCCGILGYRLHTFLRSCLFVTALSFSLISFFLEEALWMPF